jgi:hypothetical protein
VGLFFTHRRENGANNRCNVFHSLTESMWHHQRLGSRNRLSLFRYDIVEVSQHSGFHHGRDWLSIRDNFMFIRLMYHSQSQRCRIRIFLNDGYDVVIIDETTSDRLTLSTRYGLSFGGLTFYDTVENLDAYRDFSQGGHICADVDQLPDSRGFTIPSYDNVTYTVIRRNTRFNFDFALCCFKYFATRFYFHSHICPNPVICKVDLGLFSRR